jgi:hypothetical protein
LFLIILGTLPFYLLGFWLWGTAPSSNSSAAEGTVTATQTPIGIDASATDLLPTITPRATSTALFQLNPTPIQFIPPPQFSSPTPFVIIPQPTLAPTLTPFPSATPIPLPSATPIPLPTNTPLPLPTDIPPATPLPPPSDTPAP